MLFNEIPLILVFTDIVGDVQAVVHQSSTREDWTTNSSASPNHFCRYLAAVAWLSADRKPRGVNAAKLYSGVEECGEFIPSLAFKGGNESLSYSKRFIFG